jgi:DNA-binding transcriptional LysR family regulator
MPIAALNFIVGWSGANAVSAGAPMIQPTSAASASPAEHAAATRRKVLRCRLTRRAVAGATDGDARVNGTDSSGCRGSVCQHVAQRAHHHNGLMDRIDGLLLFLRVVDTGSFSKAAAEFGITQPTATKAVAAIEQRLGARLLHRTTRGVRPTEVGTMYYDKCKSIAQDIESVENLATLMQSGVAGTLRVTTSVAFGRRVLVPLAMQYMRKHPSLTVDLSFDDRFVNMVEQGFDLAVRMGRLADSTLGARYLGRNPWVMVAAPAYLKDHGTPKAPRDLSQHACLIYSSVQGDDRWMLAGPDGREQAVPVRGPLRSNNLSAVLAAAREGLGIAILPRYVARESVADGSVVPILERCSLPTQEIHAVFPSPKLVPGKVSSFIEHLREALDGAWWERGN